MKPPGSRALLADGFVPSVDGQLRCDHCRAASVAFLQDLQKVVAGACVKRLQPPVVKDQEIRPSEASQEAGMTSVAASQRQVLEQSGHALIENRLVVPAGLVTQRGGAPAFANAGWPHEDQIVVPLDPVALGQLLEQVTLPPGFNPV